VTKVYPKKHPALINYRKESKHAPILKIENYENPLLVLVRSKSDKG
jgi:hypothetical protein